MTGQSIKFFLNVKGQGAKMTHQSTSDTCNRYDICFNVKIDGSRMNNKNNLHGSTKGKPRNMSHASKCIISKTGQRNESNINSKEQTEAIKCVRKSDQSDVSFFNDKRQIRCIISSLKDSLEKRAMSQSQMTIWRDESYLNDRDRFDG